MPDRHLLGPPCRAAPIDPRVSASTTLAPPCSRPKGWRLPATGIRPTSRSGLASMISMPMRLAQLAERRAPARAPRSPSPAQPRISRVTPSPRSSPAAPARRPLAGLPRVLRAAGRELLHHHRAAHQRRLRLHLDAHQRPARREAHPPRRRVRRVAQDLPHRRSTPSTRRRGRRARTSSRARCRSSARCSTPSTSRTSRPRASRPTTSSRRSRRRPRPRGSTSSSSPATATPTSSSTTHVTVLYPKKGVSDLARMTPEAVEEKYGLTPGAVPRLRRAARRPERQPARRSPAWGRRRRRSGCASSGRSPTLVDRVDEVKGKAGDALRAAPRRRACATGASPSSCATCPLPVAPGRPRAPAVRPRHACTRCSTRCSSACCASGCSPSHGDDAATAAGAGRGRRRGARAGGARAPGSTAHAAVGRAHGVALDGRWGRGTGDVDGRSPIAAPDGAVASWPAGLAAGRRRPALAAWLADPERPKAMHDAKGPELALRARGLSLGRAHVRHRARGLPRAAGPAQLRPRRPRAAVPRAASSAAAPASALDQLSLRHRRGRGPRRDARPAGRARCSTSPTRSRPSSRRAAARRSCARSSCRCCTCSPTSSRPASRSTSTTSTASRPSSPRPCAAPRSAAHELAGRPFNLGSPKQLQEILFGERGLPTTKKIKTGYTTDAEALQTCSCRPATRCSSSCCAGATSRSCARP